MTETEQQNILLWGRGAPSRPSLTDAALQKREATGCADEEVDEYLERDVESTTMGYQLAMTFFEAPHVTRGLWVPSYQNNARQDDCQLGTLPPHGFLW
jgi:hypothetical protein